MKRIIEYIFASILLSAQAVAADKPEYAVASIPMELLKDADYVIREESILFKVSSISKAVERVKIVVTILNQRAADEADLILFYNDHFRIKSMKGAMYNQNGKELTKIRQGDIRDYNATSSGQFMDDNRAKIVDLDPPYYPVTIEHEYEIEYSGIFIYPDWEPRSRIRSSVEKSEFTILTPDVIPVRIKSRFLYSEPIQTVENGIRSYKWSVAGLPAIKEYEPNQCRHSDNNPRLMTAPVTFEFGGFKGNMETWEGFGKWIWQLNEGRDALPETTVAAVQQMTDGLDERAKIEKLYKYLQSKTRYVGIQLGIGGLQTFEASVVDKLGYGDCKGLTNYMKAMLNAVDIQSYYALVKAGDLESDIDADFPSSQFNHVILCAPLEQDTIWLECTSQNMPFSFLGQFTSNRHALLVTEEGGKLVKTKSFTRDDNFMRRYVEIRISETGDASVSAETSYGGYQSDYFLYLKTKSYDDQKKQLYERFGMSGVEIRDFSFSQKDNDLGETTEKLSMAIRRYASMSAKRMTFNPNVLNKTAFNLPALENRQSDIDVKYSYFDADTVKIFLPDKFYPEFLPEEKRIESEFGEYYSKTIAGERTITYIRIVKKNAGTYPAEKYTEYANFIREISKADNSKIALKSET